MNSLTNGQIKHIIDGAPDGATHYDTHRHGFKYWAIKMDFVTHNLSDLAEILALRERVEKFERELEWIQTKYNTEMRIRQAYQSGSEEVARKAFVEGANWWAQCELDDTLHSDEHEAASEYAQREYGIKEQL
jgi:hypothetical protein